jgi:hypothetical protein
MSKKNQSISAPIQGYNSLRKPVIQQPTRIMPSWFNNPNITIVLFVYAAVVNTWSFFQHTQNNQCPSH